MKIGRIPLASIVLLVISLIIFVSKYYFTSAYQSLKPYFDWALVGAMLVFGLYYANIFITAWMNNRKEALGK
jgi:tryptophan-rich sensory protein